jgi:carbon monoxide dehydrogenase subunit G
MKIEGTYRFEAPRERVWELLRDVEALADCIPGCSQLEPTGDDRYAARLVVGVAAFKGTYVGTVRIGDEDPPRSFNLYVEGSGRAGFASGVGHMALEPDGDAATVVQVTGDVQVGGPVLSVGSRLVVPTAKMLMNQFFAAMQRRLAAEREAQPAGL